MPAVLAALTAVLLAGAVAAGSWRAEADGAECGSIWRSARSGDAACDGPLLARAVAVAALVFGATVTASSAWAVVRRPRAGCGAGPPVLGSTPMDLDEARRFLAEHHRGVLSTFRSDGRPQLSPVTASIGADGRLVVSSRETAFKVRNLRRDPRVSYCGFTDAFFGRWLQVDGVAEIISLPEAMELLVAYYRSVSGEHPDWDDYRAAMVRERRVVIAVTPERAGPDRQG